MNLIVLRLGHRKNRDKRITTHVCLTARAFGASGVIISGEMDKSVINSVNNVVKRWGGKFKVFYKKNWENLLLFYKKNGYKIIHLTMYGEPLNKKIKEIRKFKKIIAIVGGEKVPKKVYELSDFNISITNQPHSEVSALSIFLHEYFEGKELNKIFRNYKIKVVPQKCGKKVIFK